MPKTHFTTNYEMYMTIIQTQLCKLHIRYHVEDFIQEGLLVLFEAERDYQADKCPVQYKQAYLTQKVNWHFKTLLRAAYDKQAKNEAYIKQLCKDSTLTYDVCHHWREIVDPRYRITIKMLSEGYTKTEIAEYLHVSRRTIHRYCDYLRDFDKE